MDFELSADQVATSGLLLCAPQSKARWVYLMQISGNHLDYSFEDHSGP
jgi:hypothetical protein